MSFVFSTLNLRKQQVLAADEAALVQTVIDKYHLEHLAAQSGRMVLANVNGSGLIAPNESYASHSLHAPRNDDVSNTNGRMQSSAAAHSNVQPQSSVGVNVTSTESKRSVFDFEKLSLRI